MTLGRALDEVANAKSLALEGRVTGLTGLIMRARMPQVRVGDICEVERADGSPLLAEVVGFVNEEANLLPYGGTQGVGPESRVRVSGSAARIPCSEALLGRVIDGFGRPRDGGAELAGGDWPIDRASPEPLLRTRVREPLTTGLRVIDGLATVGIGQRVALLAGPGAGKSTLLSQVARSTAADVVVVGLVGERGREVREFVEDGLGAVGRKRAVVVVATADESALLRLRAAHAATAIAEFFRDQGRHVLLLVDSLTRYARALREVALAAGEPPARQGFPPSVFDRLPRLLERAGPAAQGAITALYAVLAPGGDLEDPIADEIMALLDGHIVLDAKLAAAGRFPAVDPVRTLSRVMPSIVDATHVAAAARVRALCATLAEKQDLIAVGAYKPGSDAAVDRALAKQPAIERFLRQAQGEVSALAETRKLLLSLSQ